MEGTGIPKQKAGCLPILSDILSYKQQHQTPQKNSQQQQMSPTNLIMVALWNRAGHYIFALWFLSSSFFFFPRLIPAIADWMPTIHGVVLV